MSNQSFEDVMAKLREGFPSPYSCVKENTKVETFLQSAEHELNILRNPQEKNVCYLGNPARWMQSKEDIVKRQVNAELQQEPDKPLNVIRELVKFFNGLPDPNHPLTMENVLPPVSLPGIAAHMLGSNFNPNMVDDMYCWNVACAEVDCVGMTSKLIGYDCSKACGVMTFGGTGNYLYAMKLALIQCLGEQVKQTGVREDVKIISSSSGHYVKITACDWLGLGTNNLITIPVTDDNTMDLQILEQTLDDCYKKGEKVAMIVCTMGTTDAIAFDDVLGVVAIRNRLVKKYKLEKEPFIYCDAVIGWIWSVFREYDFEKNPLSIPKDVATEIKLCCKNISYMNLADAVGVDFHKTGFSPYNCSLFIAKERSKMEWLRRKANHMAYLFTFSVYDIGQMTLETSRGGSACLAAWATMKFFGVQGYQALIAHLINLQQTLRKAIVPVKNWVVVNSPNYGLVTLIRMYKPGVDAEKEWALEQENATPDSIMENNKYQHRIAAALFNLRLNESSPALNFTSAFRCNKNGAPFSALKVFTMSPFADPKFMQETVISTLLKAEGIVLDQIDSEKP